MILIALLGIAGQALAQTSLQNYASYDLEEHTNTISDVLRVRSAACLNFGYLNMHWADPNVPMTTNVAPFYPDYTMHGFNYNGDFLFPIWGPIGLNWNMIGMNFGMGKVKGTATGDGDDDFAIHMSWNMGLMPVLNFYVTPSIQLRGYAGIKAYLQFMLDGTDQFPINTLNDGVETIGRMGWLNKCLGAEIVFGKTGIRFMYEQGLSGRLKDKYYADHNFTRDLWDPRYTMISVGLTFWMEN